MKKALALALVLVMLFALCACGSSRKDEPALGAWKLTGLKMDGEDYSSFVSMFDMALNFKEDGTGTLTSEGEDIPLKWDSNSFTDGADTFQYSFDADGNLTFEAEGTLFIFSRA